MVVHNSNDPTLEGTPKSQAVHTEPDFGKARVKPKQRQTKAELKVRAVHTGLSYVATEGVGKDTCETWDCTRISVAGHVASRG